MQTRYVYAAQVEFEQPPRHSRPLVQEDLTECSCIAGGMTAVLRCVDLQHGAPRGTVVGVPDNSGITGMCGDALSSWHVCAAICQLRCLYVLDEKQVSRTF